jgi:hypothetical protein
MMKTLAKIFPLFCVAFPLASTALAADWSFDAYSVARCFLNSTEHPTWGAPHEIEIYAIGVDSIGGLHPGRAAQVNEYDMQGVDLRISPTGDVSLKVPYNPTTLFIPRPPADGSPVRALYSLDGKADDPTGLRYACIYGALIHVP